MSGRPGPPSTAAAVALITLVLVLAPGTFAPGQADAQEKDGRQTNEATPGQPTIRATSWALIDADTGVYLAGKNPDRRLPIASTANVMTALVALEEGVDLREEVTISDEAERFVGFTYSNIGLIEGERLSTREALEAALIPSATEAIYALAEHLGGGSVATFVEQMNKLASTLDLENTRFANPAGIDESSNYSSARDLAKIARKAMEYPLFSRIVGTEEATITTQSRQIDLFTTNELLYTYGAATGVKTGTSPEAGPCLVASATDGEESYIAVVLDAANEEYRFEAAQRVLEFGFNDYERRNLVREGEVYETLELPFRPQGSVPLVASRDVSGLVGPGLDAERRATHKEAPPSAEGGERLGRVEVFVDGQSVGSSPLVAKDGYEEASSWQKAQYAVVWPVQRLWAALQEAA